jgi:hypothetical protein
MTLAGFRFISPILQTIRDGFCMIRAIGVEWNSH